MLKLEIDFSVLELGNPLNFSPEELGPLSRAPLDI